MGGNGKEKGTKQQDKARNKGGTKEKRNKRDKRHSEKTVIHRYCNCNTHVYTNEVHEENHMIDRVVPATKKEE